MIRLNTADYAARAAEIRESLTPPRDLAAPAEDWARYHEALAVQARCAPIKAIEVSTPGRAPARVRGPFHIPGDPALRRGR